MFDYGTFDQATFDAPPAPLLPTLPGPGSGSDRHLWRRLGMLDTSLDTPEPAKRPKSPRPIWDRRPEPVAAPQPLPQAPAPIPLPPPELFAKPAAPQLAPLPSFNEFVPPNLPALNAQMRDAQDQHDAMDALDALRALGLTRH